MTVILFLASFGLILTNVYRIIRGLTPDFSVLWYSAQDLVMGGINPYMDPRFFTPNAYPPVSLLPYIPLTFLNYGSAQAIFTLISFASIVGSVYLSIKICEKRVPWQHFLLFLSLSFLSFPVKFTLGMGQINTIVLFLLLLGFYLEGAKKYVAAGIAIGISIILKPIFVFFLLFFALIKSWKVIWTSVATSTLATLSTLLFRGFAPWLDWFKTGIVPLASLAGRESYYNQGLIGFISRITKSIDVRKDLSGLISIILIGLGSLFTFRKHSRNLTFSFFILTLLLIDSISWQHHFVWLIFPFVVFFNFAIKAKKALFWGLIFIAYLLAAWNFKNPTIYQSFPKSLLLSNQFYSALILLGLNFYFLKDDYQSRQRYQ